MKQFSDVANRSAGSTNQLRITADLAVTREPHIDKQLVVKNVNRFKCRA